MEVFNILKGEGVLVPFFPMFNSFVCVVWVGLIFVGLALLGNVLEEGWGAPLNGLWFLGKETDTAFSGS